MADLSVLIPSRNEMWLKRTVEDVLRNAKADTDVIVILDGAWPVEPLEQHPKVTLVHHPQSVGQRAATNEAARVSDAKYVMKLDAHCALDEGFDVKLIEAAQELGPDVTQIPAQKNLHVFDWICVGEMGLQPCGWRQYQGPTPMVETRDAPKGSPKVPGCPKCGGEIQREIVWKPRRGVYTTAWRFDSTLHFQYWGEFSNRETTKAMGDFPETMSCLGACFFMERARYWEIDGLDEQHGSWGQMGTEIGCKSWLSGGRMVTNKRTWFAHLFRTQGGDFGFPYEIRGSEQEAARKYSRALWLNNGWRGQVRPLSWMLDHFAPVPGWDKGAANAGAGEPAGAAGPAASGAAVPSGSAGPRVVAPRVGLTRGIVYYSDCRGDDAILSAVRKQLKRAGNGHKIVAATLAPLKEHFDRNIVLSLERGYLTMFKQILAGVEACDADIVFLAEHDVLYSPDHFAFVPPTRDRYYYNLNVWKVDAATGHALHYFTRQTSGLCADRELLLAHYRRRVQLVEEHGFSRKMGFEPGTHGRAERVDDIGCGDWRSDVPNIDIRHGHNLTPSRWKQEQFRSARNCREWQESDSVPGWGRTEGRFAELLKEIGR